jgi:hypothetical protein
MLKSAFLLFVFLIYFNGNAFKIDMPYRHSSIMKMGLVEYKEELARTASTIATPGKICTELYETYEIHC